MYDTPTLDKLYLEWSNLTSAKTAKDLANERRIAKLEAALREIEKMADRKTMRAIIEIRGIARESVAGTFKQGAKDG